MAKSWQISVDYSVYNDYSYRSPEEFGAWREDNTVTIHDTFQAIASNSKLGRDRYYDVHVGFEPVKDRDYYLVFGIYSSGDSFGRETGKVAFIELFEDESKAHEFVKLIGKTSEYSVKFDDVTYYIPWVGHFESLEVCDVKRVRLSERSRQEQFNSRHRY